MSVIPALIVGVTSLQYSSHALDTLALKQATTLQKINANQTTQHFIDIQNNIETLADSLSLLIEKQGLETAIVDVDPLWTVAV